MAYIYKITNDINGKVYIGKTELSIERRFQQHCYDSQRGDIKNRPLYAAMNKYGIEHFHIEQIEETTNPNERECFWIEYYGSFKNGYNATIGGEGKRYIDYDIVVATYKELKSVKATAEKLGIDYSYTSKILKAKEINVISSAEHSIEKGKVVNQYDLQGNFIQSFPSIQSAAKALGKITSSSRGATSHISDVCKGKRKTAYGYIWKFS